VKSRHKGNKHEDVLTVLYLPRILRAIFVPSLLALMLTAQSEQQQPGRAGYRLGPDDQVLLRVANAPDISDKPVRIDSDGYIKLPMIGRVQAAGMTAGQLEAELTKRLKVYLEEPDVAVSVAEFHSQPVSIIGAVGSPGLHQLEGHKTLVEMLSLAGGLRPDAGPTAKITRRLEWGRVPLPGAKDDPTGQFSIAEVNLRSIINAKDPEENIAICPEDIISVPQADMVFVLGEVTKTGGLPLNEGDRMSVLEALSNAGGALRTASPAKAQILRIVPGSKKREELPVNLRKVQAGKADDVSLMAGDILFVPGSNTKRASIRAAEAAVQVGTMALTYGMIR
jgi:polysaccharide export outer membrane protein